MFIAPCAEVITKPTLRKVTNAKRKRNSMTKLNAMSAASKAQTRMVPTIAARIALMTDITELAQKRSAAISRLRGAFEPGHTNQREVDALSYAVDVMNELVEAMESEQRICSTWRKTAEANSKKLESRTVTVKLLDCDLTAVQHMSGGSKDYCNGFVDGTQNAIRAMRAAGVDVREAE